MNSTPRFADAFRVSIEKVLEPLQGGGFFKSPNSLRAGLVALDMSLEKFELENREKLTRGGARSLEEGERKQTKMFLNKVEAVRRALAAPPRVRTDAELLNAVRTRGMKEGDPYVRIMPNGGLSFDRVPAAAIGR